MGGGGVTPSWHLEAILRERTYNCITYEGRKEGRSTMIYIKYLNGQNKI